AQGVVDDGLAGVDLQDLPATGFDFGVEPAHGRRLGQVSEEFDGARFQHDRPPELFQCVVPATLADQGQTAIGRGATSPPAGTAPGAGPVWTRGGRAGLCLWDRFTHKHWKPGPDRGLPGAPPPPPTALDALPPPLQKTATPLVPPPGNPPTGGAVPSPAAI